MRLRPRRGWARSVRVATSLASCQSPGQSTVPSEEPQMNRFADTLKNPASSLACALLMARLALMTSET